MTDPAAARGTYAAAPQPAKVRVDLDDAAYNVVLDVARTRRRALRSLGLGNVSCSKCLRLQDRERVALPWISGCQTQIEPPHPLCGGAMRRNVAKCLSSGHSILEILGS